MSVYELSNAISAFADAGMFFLLFEAFLEHRKKLRSNAYVISVICLGIALGGVQLFPDVSVCECDRDDVAGWHRVTSI